MWIYNFILIILILGDLGSGMMTGTGKIRVVNKLKYLGLILARKCTIISEIEKSIKQWNKRNFHVKLCSLE
jgi:hypothetical protein